MPQSSNGTGTGHQSIKNISQKSAEKASKIYKVHPVNNIRRSVDRSKSPIYKSLYQYTMQSEEPSKLQILATNEDVVGEAPPTERVHI